MIAPPGFEFARTSSDEFQTDHATPVGSSVGLCGSGVRLDGRRSESGSVCRTCSRLIGAKLPTRIEAKAERQRGIFSQSATVRANALERATGAPSVVPTPIVETPWCMGPIVEADTDGSERQSCRYRSSIVVRAEAGYSGRQAAFFCSNESHRAKWTAMLDRRGVRYEIEASTLADLAAIRQNRRRT